MLLKLTIRMTNTLIYGNKFLKYIYLIPALINCFFSIFLQNLTQLVFKEVYD